jgi:hypothetical protein
LRYDATKRKVAGSIPDKVIAFFFSITKSFQPHYGPGVDSASNGNDYKRIYLGRGKARPAHKSDNLFAICEPIVYKIWDPRHLTTLSAFTPVTGLALLLLALYKGDYLCKCCSLEIALNADLSVSVNNIQDYK